MSEQLHKAVVLTALSVEYEAVRSYLANVHEEQDAVGSVYEVGYLGSGDTAWKVCLAEIGAGNVNAGIQAMLAINHFKPSIALFVGVAGGLKDVGIGDVVAATKVYGYESGKEPDEGFLPRPEVGNSDYCLVQRARAEARGHEWQNGLDGTFQAFVGPIAAGEKVVASTRSATFKFLSKQYSDAVAVEMEGFGFLKALHVHKEVFALIIRGISDLIAGKTRSDADGSQQLASRNAAAFAVRILQAVELPTAGFIAESSTSKSQPALRLTLGIPMFGEYQQSPDMPRYCHHTATVEVTNTSATMLRNAVARLEITSVDPSIGSLSTRLPWIADHDKLELGDTDLRPGESKRCVAIGVGLPMTDDSPVFVLSGAASDFSIVLDKRVVRFKGFVRVFADGLMKPAESSVEGVVKRTPGQLEIRIGDAALVLPYVPAMTHRSQCKSGVEE